MALLARTSTFYRIHRAFTAARCISNQSLKTQTSQQVWPKYESFANTTTFLSNNWMYKQPYEIITPLSSNSISFPNGIVWIPPNIDSESLPIEAPAAEQHIEKQAARLIVIRRKKMKKHKLRKLRKRMKFEWAKIRQKRELKKEKLFHAELIAQCKTAETFDAEKYVQERIDKLHEVIVQQSMGLPPETSTKN